MKIQKINTGILITKTAKQPSAKIEFSLDELDALSEFCEGLQDEKDIREYLNTAVTIPDSAEVSAPIAAKYLRDAALFEQLVDETRRNQEENQSNFLTAVSDAVSSIEKSRDVKEWHGLTKETAERFAREFMAERNPGRWSGFGEVPESVSLDPLIFPINDIYPKGNKPALRMQLISVTYPSLHRVCECSIIEDGVDLWARRTLDSMTAGTVEDLVETVLYVARIRDIRDSHRLDTMADYVDMYSTASGYDTADDITVLLPSSSYETMGMAFTHQALKQYEKSIDNHLFRKHRCYAACGEGYGREAGDYYPIMNFIRDAGEQLLIQDLENFDVKVMELASDDEVADFYCEHPHELFRAAYIKVSEKDTIGKCYSRLYVFCSGHEEAFSDGSSFPVCDSHYVMVVKEGKKYKVPYPFDCNRFADELNKKSNEKERLTPAQRLFFWTEYKKPIE